MTYISTLYFKNKSSNVCEKYSPKNVLSFAILPLFVIDVILTSPSWVIEIIGKFLILKFNL